MDIKQFLNSGIIEKYVLGLADREDMNRVEKMAAEYPEVNQHICKMQNCMEEYAEMHAIKPPKHLKNKILSKIKDKAGAESIERNLVVERPTTKFQIPSSWKFGAGLAAMMILTLGAVSWMLYSSQKEAEDEIAILSTQIKHLQSDQKSLQASNDKIIQKYAVLKDVTTRQVHLKGSHHAPQALAVVYWNPDHSKGYLNVVDLPKCPNGHAYQMWADVNGKHIDMGMVKLDSIGAILNKIPYIEDSRGFVITLEKEGGSPHPTVEKMFVHGAM